MVANTIVAVAAETEVRLREWGGALGNSYALLPERFYTRLDPNPVAGPHLIRFNATLAADLGLDGTGVDAEVLASIFSGNRLIPGSRPIAMVYAGHQFGQFVPQLGDGRAILLGDVRDRSGQRRDIQLKGSGRTPYSRSGDGRAAVGPVLREYLVSESMHALGIPATRALAAVTTGEAVFREQRVPGAVLTRVAASHVRVGTFQYFASRGDIEATRRLAEFVIERHYPDLAHAANPYLELLRSVVERQARLIAAWMNVGFIHGVMNTDNMAVSGETIDFGPCAFMDSYAPSTVFSSIDHRGRYAYVNQPAAAQWNLARFAETLLPHIDAHAERAVELASAAVSEFAAAFDGSWLAGMRNKLGLFTQEAEDGALGKRLLDAMHDAQADFTRTFRQLCAAADGGETASAATAGFAAPNGATASGSDEVAFQDSFSEVAALRDWLPSWRARLSREPRQLRERVALMRSANPAVVPRNHRIEQAIVAAIEHADYAPFEQLMRVLALPYADPPDGAAYREAPRPHERVLQTFCGT